MKKTVIFYLLCLITAALFLNSLFAVLKLKNPISILAPVYNSMNVIIETETKNPSDIILKADNDFTSVPPSKNMLNKSLEGKIKTLDIFVKEDFKNEIKSIVIFNDLKLYYFKDFSEFKKETAELCPLGVCKNYIKYTVPNSVKFNKNSDSYNFRTPLNTFCVAFMSLFQWHTAFLIPYILLFFTIFYFVNNKKEIKKPKYNGLFIAGALFILVILLRFNGLFDYLPWADEYYSVEFSRPDSGFISIFGDPGNPPLFYLLFKIWLFVFKISTVSIKTFPFLTGIFAAFSLWFFLKKEFNLKTANTGLFIFAINIPLIYYSGEARSYILQAFLTPVYVYFLFKILDKGNKRDFIIYGILTALLSNIHYYEILFIISNFIFGEIYLLIQKKKKQAACFFLTNIIGGLFFLPFFIATAFNKALVSTGFNDWIPNTDFNQIKKCILYLFGGGISFIMSILALIYGCKNLPSDSKEKRIIIYAFAIISMTVILAIAVSYIVRPILVERYLVLLYPLFIIFLSVSFNNLKFKYAILVILIWIFSIQSMTVEKNNRRKGIIDGPLVLSTEFNKTKPKNKNIYVVTNLSSTKYLKEHEKYLIKDATYVPKMVREAEDAVKNILNSDKNAIIFTSILNPDEKNSKAGNGYSCFFNSATDLCIWKIENEN